MVTGLQASDTPTQSSITAGKIASSLTGVIGAIGAFYGAFRDYGVFDATFLVLLIVLGIGLANFLPHLQIAPITTLVNRFSSLYRGGKLAIVLIAAGLAGLLFLWLGSFVFHWIEPNFFRRHFTDKHDRIKVTEVDYAAAHFKEREDDDVGDQQTAERESHDQWLRWMAAGATTHVKADEETNDEEQQLIYVEGCPFDGNYTSTKATVTVAEPLEIVEGVAFLKRDVPAGGKGGGCQEASRWYKPEMRAMDLDKTDSKQTAKTMLSDPNDGEAPVFFLKVRLSEGKDFPGRDQILVNKEIAVSP